MSCGSVDGVQADKGSEVAGEGGDPCQSSFVFDTGGGERGRGGERKGGGVRRDRGEGEVGGRRG